MWGEFSFHCAVLGSGDHTPLFLLLLLPYQHRECLEILEHQEITKMSDRVKLWGVQSEVGE
jgi:hypothetical protein